MNYTTYLSVLLLGIVIGQEFLLILRIFIVGLQIGEWHEPKDFLHIYKQKNYNNYIIKIFPKTCIEFFDQTTHAYLARNPCQSFCLLRRGQCKYTGSTRDIDFPERLSIDQE